MPEKQTIKTMNLLMKEFSMTMIKIKMMMMMMCKMRKKMEKMISTLTLWIKKPSTNFYSLSLQGSTERYFGMSLSNVMSSVRKI